MNAYTPHDARTVANLLLAKGMEECVALTPMKMLKLVYIAHGWTLGITDNPLIKDTVYAWRYGPVIENVYHAFKHFGGEDIASPALVPSGKLFDWHAKSAHLEGPIKETVDRVWELYKGYSGTQLSTMTHRPGSPWAIVTADKSPDEVKRIVIPNELITQHYRTLALSKAKLTTL